MDGLNIHGDLLEIIARAEAAGISGSEAATVKLAEAGAAHMKNILSGPGGGDGSPPAERTGALAGSIKVSPRYTSTGVKVHVGPTGQRKFVGNILDKGWHAHGPVRARGTGSYHRRPFTEQVAAASEAEAHAICSAEVEIHIRQAGL